MAKVEVDRRVAVERRLPSVSVKSGAPADGYAPAGKSGEQVFVPLTQAEFNQAQYLRRRQKSAIYGGVAFFVLGAALSRFTLLLPLGAIIGVLSVALWVLATMTLKRFLPGVAISTNGQRVELSRVHRGFVAAVSEAEV
jgi:hypothetical protein